VSLLRPDSFAPFIRGLTELLEFNDIVRVSCEVGVRSTLTRPHVFHCHCSFTVLRSFSSRIPLRVGVWRY
jgi:hypothetical protein